MSTAEPHADPDAGALANNFMFVRGLQSTLSTSETNIKAVVGSLKIVIGQGCWRHWINMEGREFRWNAADFRQFIEAPRPAGCQVSVAFIRGLIRDSPLAEAFEGLIRGERGNPNHECQPRNEDGTFGDTRNRNNVTDTDELATIPLAPNVPRPRVRDFSREAQTGNSVSYKLRQLERGRKVRGGDPLPPRPDLLEKVRKGEMSPHAAAVEAGFEKPKVTLPIDPPAAVRLIVKHFQGEDLDALIRGLANWRGFTVTESAE